MSTPEEVANNVVERFAADLRETARATESAATTAENMVPLKKFATAADAVLKKLTPDLKIEVQTLPWKYDGKEMSGGLTVNQDALTIVVTPGNSAVTINGNRVEQQQLWNVIGTEVSRLLQSNVTA